jgi:gliding motility-associated-like protein
MKKRQLDIILLLFSFFPYSASSQINCTVPLPAMLSSVSVQPETSQTEFRWIPSESTDIAAYIIYSYKDGDGLPLDTVWDPAATSHTISNNAPKYSSVSYVVAAHRLSLIPGTPGCTSPLSNVITSIFCEASTDTCNKKIIIDWNPYPDYPKPVTSYSVMISLNGSAFSEEVTTEPGITNYTIDNFITDANYCFYIRANLEGGSSSTSNKACVLTKMQRPPAWINADYATVNPGSGIMLSFSIDPASEITHFLLEKKTGQSGIFGQLAQLASDNGSVIFNDSKADLSIVNNYRLSAINSCNFPVTVSNISSNMVLALDREENHLNLSWNQYRAWSGTVADYRLHVDTGNGFIEKDVISADDSTYTLDYKEIMYEVTGNDICIYISASEVSNPHGLEGQSNSSTICTEPLELITVPNIFTPNNDLVNDLFKPVLSFTPTNYHLIISDQHGTVLFETRDWNEPWDGSAKGKLQPDGICLWFLKVSSPSGKNMTRTGTVTILKNP